MVEPHVQANGLEKFKDGWGEHRDSSSVGAGRKGNLGRVLYQNIVPDGCVKIR